MNVAILQLQCRIRIAIANTDDKGGNKYLPGSIIANGDEFLDAQWRLIVVIEYFFHAFDMRWRTADGTKVSRVSVGASTLRSTNLNLVYWYSRSDD